MTMTIFKKQTKITKLFGKAAGSSRAQAPEDCQELLEEIQELEQKLKTQQDELFQLQRNCFRRKQSPVKKRDEPFIRPDKIILSNSAETLKKNLELMSMLTGMEVQSYVEDHHCCIVYHMQHDSQHEIKHGLRIDMNTGTNSISQSSLPLGFNLNAVLEDFVNVMLPECLCAVRKALVAYYDRLEQFENLKKYLNIEAHLFKIIDGSHIEVSFLARNDEEDQQLVLMLDYRVYDIRPKQISFRETDLTEDAVEALKEQCAVFKKKPLVQAFKAAFINGDGPYSMVQQVSSRPVERKRRKPKRMRPNKNNFNDDTFLPEDCSDSSEDDDDEAN